MGSNPGNEEAIIRLANPTLTLNELTIEAAIEAWTKANYWILRLVKTAGSKRGYRDTTTDDVLSSRGVEFKTNPRLWCAYEGVIRSRIYERGLARRPASWG